MDKIEPLQTQKAYWCWGSYLWNLSCDFNILQAHFRLNASFNDSIRLIRPNLSSPTVSRKGWGVGDTLDLKCHIMSYKKDWYVMYWIYLSTFQCCCCCCFWCWWCSFCCCHSCCNCCRVASWCEAGAIFSHEQKQMCAIYIYQSLRISRFSISPIHRIV